MISSYFHKDTTLSIDVLALRCNPAPDSQTARYPSIA